MEIEPELYGKIVSAALLKDNCIYMAGEGHHAIFTMEPLGVLKSAKQGFVTEYGYFVNRETTLYIAEYFDQVDTKYNPQDRLVSEDLKKEDLKVLRYVKKYSYKERQK